jgi:hypothetical protein
MRHERLRRNRNHIRATIGISTIAGVEIDAGMEAIISIIL